MTEQEAATMCPFVTVTPTIQSGIVVRWFVHQYDMESCRPMISASRDNVTIHDARIRTSTDMRRFTALLDVAHDVMGSILNGDDVKHFATHEREGFGGEHRPVPSRRTGAAT